jgi:HemY protein
VKGLFWILALAGLAVAIALGARLNDGYLLMVLPPWRIEISLNLAIVALLVIFSLFYVVMRLLGATFGLPQRVREFRERRQRDQAASVFQDAVRLLFEGRFGQAMKKASEAHGAGTAPGLSALIAARAAQRMREPEKQQYWLEHAKTDDPRTEAATLMLDAEMANEERRFSDALDALGRLQGKQGRHIAALRLELRARQGAGDWGEVLKLVRQLAKRDALPPEVVVEIRTQAHLANIAKRRSDQGQLIAYLRGLPDEERGRRISLAAAKALIRLDAEGEAQKLIEATLDRADTENWQSELADIYGRLSGGEQTVRIARAEAWLRRHPHDAVLLIALGRMCQRQRLWGKAQSYLEASLSVKATQEAHLELARLLDQLDKVDAANKHYRASAQLNAS